MHSPPTLREFSNFLYFGFLLYFCVLILLHPFTDQTNDQIHTTKTKLDDLLKFKREREIESAGTEWLRGK